MSISPSSPRTATPTAPPNPVRSTLTTFTPNPSKDLFMNSGDTLLVTMHDTSEWPSDHHQRSDDGSERFYDGQCRQRIRPGEVCTRRLQPHAPIFPTTSIRCTAPPQRRRASSGRRIPTTSRSLMRSATSTTATARPSLPAYTVSLVRLGTQRDRHDSGDSRRDRHGTWQMTRTASRPRDPRWSRFRDARSQTPALMGPPTFRFGPTVTPRCTRHRSNSAAR